MSIIYGALTVQGALDVELPGPDTGIFADGVELQYPCNSDWNATSGEAEIYNKPPFTALPFVPLGIQQPTNADWNAQKGLAAILNKPPPQPLPFLPYRSETVRPSPFVPVGIAPQVKADFAATSGPAQILNQPVIPAQQNADWNAATGTTAILNKPVIPAQQNADWNAATGTTAILNKPPSYAGPFQPYRPPETRLPMPFNAAANQLQVPIPIQPAAPVLVQPLPFQPTNITTMQPIPIQPVTQSTNQPMPFIPASVTTSIATLSAASINPFTPATNTVQQPLPFNAGPLPTAVVVPTKLSQFQNDLQGSTGGWTVAGDLAATGLGTCKQGFCAGNVGASAATLVNNFTNGLYTFWNFSGGNGEGAFVNCAPNAGTGGWTWVSFLNKTKLGQPMSLSATGTLAVTSQVNTPRVQLSNSTFSGLYSELSGIPANLSQFTNDLTSCSNNWKVPGAVQTSAVQLPNAVSFTGKYSDLSNLPSPAPFLALPFLPGTKCLNMIDQVSGCQCNGDLIVTGNLFVKSSVIGSASAGSVTQVAVDWNATSGIAKILNQPTRLGIFFNDLTGCNGNWNVPSALTAATISAGSISATTALQIPNAPKFTGLYSDLGGLPKLQNVDLNNLATVNASVSGQLLVTDLFCNSVAAQQLIAPNGIQLPNSTVFTGNYTDLNNEPTNLSQFTNDLPSQSVPSAPLSNTLMCSVSSQYSNSDVAYLPFDQNASTTWRSYASSYSQSAYNAYSYTGNPSTATTSYGGGGSGVYYASGSTRYFYTTVDGARLNGDWTQLATGNGLNLTSYTVSTPGQYMCAWVLAGSTDGLNFVTIDQKNFLGIGSAGGIFPVNGAGFYTFFRLIQTLTQGKSYASLSEFSLRGVFNPDATAFSVVNTNVIRAANFQITGSPVFKIDWTVLSFYSGCSADPAFPPLAVCMDGMGRVHMNGSVAISSSAQNVSGTVGIADLYSFAAITSSHYTGYSSKYAILGSGNASNNFTDSISAYAATNSPALYFGNVPNNSVTVHMNISWWP